MNMAFTAGCFFILQCIFLVDISAADPLIDVSPSEIYLGITPTLDISCTFSPNNYPDMAAFVSLVLSRAKATGQDFQELAAITEFSPNAVKVLTQETVSATGVHSQTGQSFLSLRWEYPTALQGGIYQCSVHGMDEIGHTIEMTNISSVTVDEANLNDIFQKLQQLEMHEASMQQKIKNLESDKVSMEERIQNLENYTHTLENDKVLMANYITILESNVLHLESNVSHLESNVSHLESNVSHLESNVSHLVNEVEFVTPVYLLGRYNTKSYYLSKYAFSDIKNAIDVCRSLGGQLAVVNDQSELTAIQNFLKSTFGIYRVYISGSDEKTEGNWVLSDSDTPLPFTSWWTGRPGTDRDLNCLMLYSYGSWTMHDFHCHLDSPYDYNRFMCEI